MRSTSSALNARKILRRTDRRAGREAARRLTFPARVTRPLKVKDLLMTIHSSMVMGLFMVEDVQASVHTRTIPCSAHAYFFLL